MFQMKTAQLLMGIQKNDRKCIHIIMNALNCFTAKEYTLQISSKGNPHVDWEDLTQEVYYEFLNSYTNFQGNSHGELCNFTKKIAKHTVKKYILNHEKHANCFSLYNETHKNLTLMDSLGNEDTMDLEYENLIPKHIIDKLSPENKELYHLLSNENFSYKKYCKEKNISNPTARKRVQRFRKALKEEIEKEYHSLSKLLYN
ncbi:RNA polymerase sigma factor [Clostridium rectalis]|uniref:RNA polymerase sigma factor n=1 Tax=Clostridium rectalis TaxID=2040295 RepID=UPI000F632575|nr:sigma-70 family RNA polymerase sigma factor [Clostridium rectalis]